MFWVVGKSVSRLVVVAAEEEASREEAVSIIQCQPQQSYNLKLQAKNCLMLYCEPQTVPLQLRLHWTRRNRPLAMRREAITFACEGSVYAESDAKAFLDFWLRSFLSGRKKTVDYKHGSKGDVIIVIFVRSILRVKICLLLYPP